MAKKRVAALVNDLGEVIQFFKDRRIITSSPSTGLLENAKRLHRATYSVILWRFRLTGLPPHSKVFIEEIASDALQILPQVLMGYGKTARLLTRGIIENSLRHIYFSDHPVEFARMNRDSKWYMTMEGLFEYAKIHPVFLNSEPRFDAINRLSTLYSDLSAGVHGRTVNDLEMRVALKKIAYVEADAKKHVEFMERCAEAANFALGVFHWDKMSGFPSDDRRVILETMVPRARRIWKEFGELLC
jgi:hypothetical protein